MEKLFNKKESDLIRFDECLTDMECEDLLAWHFFKKWSKQSSAEREFLSIEIRSETIKAIVDKELRVERFNQLLEVKRYGYIIRATKRKIGELNFYHYLINQSYENNY